MSRCIEDGEGGHSALDRRQPPKTDAAGPGRPPRPLAASLSQGGPRFPLSACAALAWNVRPAEDYRQIIDPSTQTAYVLGSYKDFAIRQQVNTSFRQTAEQEVFVEIRQPDHLKTAPEWIWQTLETCARQGA